MRFIKFLFHETLHLVWLRATGSGVPAVSGWRTHSIYSGPYIHANAKNNGLWWLWIVLTNTFTHMHPPHFIILLLAGCYWASQWQMPVSRASAKSSPSGKWDWRVQMFKDVIKAPPTHPPQWLWHLARATFHSETSTTKPVSPGAIIYSKSTHPWSWWLGLQRGMVLGFYSKNAIITNSHITDIQTLLFIK